MVIVRTRSTHRRCISAAALALAACVALYGCAASSPGDKGAVAQGTRTALAASGPPTQLSTPEELTTLAEQASGHLLQNLETVYQQTGDEALITGTVSGSIPRSSTQISAAQEKVKIFCFQIQRALWSSGIPLKEVAVTILGPVFDDYFDQIISWYGTASLEAGAAAQIDWRNLGVDAAWNRFERTLLRVNYGSFQLYGTTPVPNTSSPGGP
jgi:hypothetical protein